MLHLDQRKLILQQAEVKQRPMTDKMPSIGDSDLLILSENLYHPSILRSGNSTKVGTERNEVPDMENVQ